MKQRIITEEMKEKTRNAGKIAIAKIHQCPHCNKMLSNANIKTYEPACDKNPNNIRQCYSCSKLINRRSYFCSKSCRYKSISTNPKILDQLLTLDKKPQSVKPDDLQKKLKTPNNNPYPFTRVYRLYCNNTNSPYYGRSPSASSPYIKKTYSEYKTQAQFRFSLFKFPLWFDLSVISSLGFFSTGKYRRNSNKSVNGISRDHMYSVIHGYKQNIPIEIIKHPANCKLMPQIENNRKNSSSSITLEELYSRIKNFEKIYPNWKSM